MRFMFCSGVVFLLICSLASASDFPVLQTIQVGSAPHGLRIHDGYAYIAVSGDDEIAVLDLQSLEITQRWPVAKVPLDLIKSAHGWLVAPFRDDRLLEIDGITGKKLMEWEVASGPSLFTPHKVGNLTYIVSEFGDTLTVFDTAAMQITRTYPSGNRPYPADVTRDGVLGFIPNRGDNSVSVIDLLNQKELNKTKVCEQPEGGALSIDQVNYLVACGGSDQLMWINTASFEVVHQIDTGIGPRPFSVAMSNDGRWAFVNNAGGQQLSVIDMVSRQVVDKIDVGKQPIVMRVEGNRLYVTNEVSGTLSIVGIPDAQAADRDNKINEVLMLGMIHSGHVSSERYSLTFLSRLLKAAKPDYVLVEIPPNRLTAAQQDYTQFGEIREQRAARFPEYTEVLFPLSSEISFEIIPTAGWNSPMNNYRRAALQRIENDPARKADWEAYQAASVKMDEIIGERDDDPLFIHSDEYDALIKHGLEPYDRLFNDELGTGGWTTINQAHYALIEQALNIHSGEGKRFVITFGAGHKYWFLEQLRQRKDIRLLDAKAFIKIVQADNNQSLQ